MVGADAVRADVVGADAVGADASKRRSNFYLGFQASGELLYTPTLGGVGSYRDGLTIL